MTPLELDRYLWDSIRELQKSRERLTKGFDPAQPRDEDGRWVKTTPLFHSTGAADAIARDGFDLGRTSSNYGNQGLMGRGVYFKTDPDKAQYGEQAVEARAAVDRLADRATFERVAREKGYLPVSAETEDAPGGRGPDGEPWYFFGPRRMSEYLKSLGYDGVRWKYSPDDEEIVIFDPEKVHSIKRVR